MTEKKGSKEYNNREARKLRPYRLGRRTRIGIIIVMMVALVCEFVVFLSYSTVDKRFIRDMDRGIKTGWYHETGENELVNYDLPNDVSFIMDEYEAVSSYKDARFRSKVLEGMAKRYVDALYGCHDAIEKYDIDEQYSEFWEEFSPYYGERIKAIYGIYNTRRFGLELVDERYAIKKEYLLVQGWALEKTTETEFRQVSEENGTVFEADFRNDSGYDLGYLDFEVELYDDKDQLVETASAYAQNIKAGEKIKLTFNQMYPGEVSEYVIASVICETVDQQNREKELGTGTR